MRPAVGVFAAIMFLIAGWQMVSLQSEAGNTVAEAFDHAVGWFSFGMAALSVAIAIPHAVSVGHWSPHTNPSLASLTTSAQASPAGTLTDEGYHLVPGWQPAGERICPRCSQKVAPYSTTHCNKCGFQLVTRPPTSG